MEQKISFTKMEPLIEILYFNFCVDDNECARSNVCGNGTCSNVEGGFECSCQDGYAPGPMQVNTY